MYKNDIKQRQHRHAAIPTTHTNTQQTDHTSVSSCKQKGGVNLTQFKPDSVRQGPVCHPHMDLFLCLSQSLYEQFFFFSFF